MRRNSEINEVHTAQLRDKYGGIRDSKALKSNMHANCIPESIFDMTIEDYDQFLEERRTLMARKMRDYYKSL